MQGIKHVFYAGIIKHDRHGVATFCQQAGKSQAGEGEDSVLEEMPLMSEG